MVYKEKSFKFYIYESGIGLQHMLPVKGCCLENKRLLPVENKGVSPNCVDISC